MSAAPPHTPIEIQPLHLIEWLSNDFATLADEGALIVDRYWIGLRQLERGRLSYQRVTLGLRQRLRANGAFSLEWFLMGPLGKSKRQVARVHLSKARHQTGYSLKVLMRRQPPFLTDHVEAIEAELVQIRVRQERLIRLRDALGAYLKLDGGAAMTGSRLIEAYRMGESLGLDGQQVLI